MLSGFVGAVTPRLKGLAPERLLALFGLSRSGELTPVALQDSRQSTKNIFLSLFASTELHEKLSSIKREPYDTGFARLLAGREVCIVAHDGYKRVMKARNGFLYCDIYDGENFLSDVISVCEARIDLIETIGLPFLKRVFLDYNVSQEVVHNIFKNFYSGGDAGAGANIVKEAVGAYDFVCGGEELAISFSIDSNGVIRVNVADVLACRHSSSLDQKPIQVRVLLSLMYQPSEHGTPCRKELSALMENSPSPEVRNDLLNMTVGETPGTEGKALPGASGRTLPEPKRLF